MYTKKVRHGFMVNPFDYSSFKELCRQRRMSVSTAINLFILQELKEAGLAEEGAHEAY